MNQPRDFTVKALTRVEGAGGLRVRVSDGRVELVEFTIYEPPRFFERLLRGREVREVPDIVARICGIRSPPVRPSSRPSASSSARRFACCDGSWHAASGSRATRSISICCTRQISSAATAASPIPKPMQGCSTVACG